jgi:formiminoglutamase
LIRHLVPQTLRHYTPWEDTHDHRISNWMAPWDGQTPIDACMLSAPFSSGTARPTASWEAANAIRNSFIENTTYSPDYDVDIQDLVVRDLGDIQITSTDVRQSLAHIEEALIDLLTEQPQCVPLAIGGDHSVSAPLVRAFSKTRPDRRIGMLHFDAHNDVRAFEEGGPLNGTPIRGIIQTCPNVAATNIVQLGIHGFMNSSRYKRWAEEQGITIYSARTIRKRGMEEVLAEAIEIAARDTQEIYVSVDLDSLSQIYCLGASGSITPDGLNAVDLLESVFTLGRHPMVGMMDLVEMNPSVDFRNLTSRTAGTILLTFLAGLLLRLKGADGYRGY